VFGFAALRIRQWYPLKLAQLNVLRTVAERLIYRQPEPVRVEIIDMAIEPIAPAGMQLNTQQPDRGASL
jgi:hypothetical protein